MKRSRPIPVQFKGKEKENHPAEEDKAAIMLSIALKKIDAGENDEKSI